MRLANAGTAAAGLEAAFGYNVTSANGDGFEALGTSLLRSSRGPAVRAWATGTPLGPAPAGPPPDRGLLESGYECYRRAPTNATAWRFANSMKGWRGRVEDLPLFAELNANRGRGDRARTRPFCRLTNLAYANGTLFASPAAAEAAWRATARDMLGWRDRIENSKDVAAQRRQACYGFLPRAPELKFADVPRSAVRAGGRQIFWAQDELQPPKNNVAHAATRGLYFGYSLARCARRDDPRCPKVDDVVLPARHHIGGGSCCGASDGCPACALGRDWTTLVKAASGVGWHAGVAAFAANAGWGPSATYKIVDAVFSPHNFGSPSSLPEEYFLDPGHAEDLRAALDAALPATADLCGAGGGCVGILARDPPRRLPPGLPAELRALLPDLGVAEVAFPRRAPSPARQFAMMRAVDVLVAPHGAALANVPFLPKCAVVLEATACGFLLSMFAALAWNSGHMWLPLYSESCPALDAPVRYGSDRRQTASSVAACTNVQRCRGPCEINLELDRVLPRGRVELWVPHRPRRCPRHRTQRDGAPRGRARSTCTAHAGGMRCRRGRSKPGTRSGPPRGLAY
ncbi:MAG TPA: hypothetical protein RMI62_13845 [Polyangiaceae bacterium LLY-WYZ-15_(1-7)]|nr:hypothetical protein [Polyangiaceae bacterium LLY-WYZ-15_(1-7)]